MTSKNEGTKPEENSPAAFRFENNFSILAQSNDWRETPEQNDKIAYKNMEN